MRRDGYTAATHLRRGARPSAARCRPPDIVRYIATIRASHYTRYAVFPGSVRQLDELNLASSSCCASMLDDGFATKGLIMKAMCLSVMMFGMSTAACLEEPDQADQVDETNQTAAITSRPALSSICGVQCNNSHGARACGDHRDSGQANVSVFPTLENATTVPSIILHTAGWAGTSCPNCVWERVSVTTVFPVGAPLPTIAQATNDLNVSKVVAASPEFAWNGTVVLRISDPTNASVGTCTLTVPVGLTGGFPF